MSFAFAGLAGALGRGVGAMGRARQEALDANRQDEERERSFQEQVKARAMQEWVQKQTLARQAAQDAYTRERDTREDAERAAAQRQRAIEGGWTDATPDTVAQGAASAARAIGGIGPGVAPTGAPVFRQKVGDVEVSAEAMGGPRYANVGGQRMRFDPQVQANADARKRAETATIAHQQRMDLARENNANRQAMLQMQREQSQRSLRPLAANKVDEFGELANVLDATDNALRSLGIAEGKQQNVTGIIPTFNATKIGQLMGGGPKEAQTAMGAITNIASQLMKARSGGAVTPQEFERLAPFLPQTWDDEERVRQKLTDLYTEINRLRTQRLNALRESGFDTGGIERAYTAPKVPGLAPGAVPGNPFEAYRR